MVKVTPLIPENENDAPQQHAQPDKHNGQGGAKDGVRLEDFYAYMPQHAYIFAPSRELWPAVSVNARVPPIPRPNGKPISAATWLDANAAVEQMTWSPGEPMLIKDRLVSDGGWIKRPGCSVFNLYRPPLLVPKVGDAKPWLDLVHNVFPSETDQIVRWLAHRVQRPHEKINHALVLGGKPGIGKGHHSGADQAGDRPVEFRRRVAATNPRPL